MPCRRLYAVPLWGEQAIRNPPLSLPGYHAFHLPPLVMPYCCAAVPPCPHSVVVEYDATAPSLIRFVYLGDEVLLKLRRPWWFELQGRYGNMFFVREEVSI